MFRENCDAHTDASSGSYQLVVHVHTLDRSTSKSFYHLAYMQGHIPKAGLMIFLFGNIPDG